MKFSENWLRQHVAIDASRETLAATLTAIGLEVEQVTVLGDGLDGVVVGRILDCAPHPQAGRLQVCRVDIGTDEPLQIVCGAPNARVGLAAPVAPIGATLPGGVAIQAALLRGVESSGMLCSAKELAVDADASGLFELPADAVPGAALADYLQLPDASFELKLTPNRADCFSVRGIAFDVAAAFGTDVAPFAMPPIPATITATVPVQLDAHADAPRYVGRVVEGIDAGRPTPLWMAERLRRSGIRPVSLLVDVTQYVMLELGQPMHAYDRGRLSGAVVVRLGRAGESLKLLDGRTVDLDDGLLVIADDSGPIGLAGLMGGFDTRVTGATRNVFLEAAHFRPDVIAGRGRRLGLSSEAAHRFERGVDPGLPGIAMEYATRLLLEAGGGAAGPLVDTCNEQGLPTPVPIGLRRERLLRLLGIAIADGEVARILRSLGMEVTDTATGWQVVPPGRRFDLALEEDLVEELARIHGYDAIPAALPSASARVARCTDGRVSDDALRGHLAARDYLEAINYAFVDAQLLCTWKADDGMLALANPLSAELGAMRTSLLPGLVAALRRNAARQQLRPRLFEIGTVFRSPGAGGDSGKAGQGEVPHAAVETLRIAAIASGPASAEQWGVATRPVDFHDIKGDLQSLAAMTGANLEFRSAAAPWAHPGVSSQVLRDGEPIGWMGQLHPQLGSALDAGGEVFAFELDLAPLSLFAPRRSGGLSKYPSVRRDLAFVVSQDLPWADLEATTRAAAGAVLRDLRLFDVYQGPGVETGFKSLAMGLILQDDSRTLTDREVDGVATAVVEALASRHGARLRT